MVRYVANVEKSEFDPHLRLVNDLRIKGVCASSNGRTPGECRFDPYSACSHTFCILSSVVQSGCFTSSGSVVRIHQGVQPRRSVADAYASCTLPREVLG